MAPLVGKLYAIINSSGAADSGWVNVSGINAPQHGLTVTVEGLEAGGSVSVAVLNRDPVNNIPLTGNAGQPHPTIPTLSANGAYSLGTDIFTFYRFQKTAGGSPTTTLVNVYGLQSR